MRTHFEKVSGEDHVLHAFERAEASFPFHWHYHPEFELTLILEGAGQRLVGDSVEDYSPGDMALLGPNLPHTYRSGPGRDGHRALVVQFRPELLGESFFALSEMQLLKDFLKLAEQGIALTIRQEARRSALIACLQGLPAKPPSTRVLELLMILDTLAHDATKHTLSRSHVPPLVKMEDQNRVNAICQFLYEHSSEEIDYERLTQKLHMSQASLCRFFRRATGRTMTDYVNDYRISVAAQMLKETDKSILEIAFEAGFGNYSHFVRCFQKSKGKTPRDFRSTFAR